MELMQQMTAAGVLLLLGATLWWLRSRGLAQLASLPARKTARRLESMERLALTPQHTLHLVRLGGRALLISSSPSGCALVETSEWRELENPSTETRP